MITYSMEDATNDNTRESRNLRLTRAVFVPRLYLCTLLLLYPERLHACTPARLHACKLVLHPLKIKVVILIDYEIG